MADRAKENILRRKAESLISQKQEVSPPPKKSPEDTEKLIQELRVHQVELEMQKDELIKAQGVIEKSRSRYVDLYDFAPVGYLTLNEKEVILEANLTGAALLGVERKLLLKTPFSLFLMPEDRDLFRDCQRKVFQIRGRQSCEVRLKRKKEDPLWVNLECVAVEDLHGKTTGVRLALSDITERKRSEEALRQSEKRLQDLSSRLLHIREMERKDIANEIHEGLLSDLGAVKFGLESKILALEEASHPIAPELRKLLRIHKQTMEQARRIMNRLGPSRFNDLGLIPALSGLCQHIQMLYPQMQVECKIDIQEEKIPDAVKAPIFRVAQEALTNSAKHGKGTLTHLSLAKASDRLEFLVQDNGRGFDLHNSKKGVGLEGMRERVEISGGEFKIETAIGRGTTIRATWNHS